MNKLKTLQNHIYRNRAKYAAATTLAVCVAIRLHSAKEWNAFLEDHNLLDEFYKFDEI